ncbi:MAG: hypothetical protein JXB24_03080 [Bacteroidales bacterium]|nr:hypothetical protein [Bacteroidales bacterium]
MFYKKELLANFNIFDTTNYEYFISEGKIDTLKILLKKEVQILDSILVLTENENHSRTKQHLENLSYATISEIQ